MIRRRLAVVVFMMGVLCTATTVSAGGDGQGSIGASATETESEPGSEPDVPPPPCRWRSYAADDSVADIYNVVEGVVVTISTLLTKTERSIRYEYYSERGILHRYDIADGQFKYKVVFRCDAGHAPALGDPVLDSVQWWVATPPDPAMLLVRTMIDVETIAAPVPDMSPPPAAGAPVNLGLWLAVEEAGPYVAWAGFNDSVWAERTATLSSTTFDPGNGDTPVTCAGRGTPIPDPSMASTAPGPCGYVYRDHADVDASIAITITMEWAVTWRLSDGRSGTDPSVFTTATVPYDVYEVQTVGGSG